jgi:RNA polymerase sigma-70 factor (ECF subfamily)
MTPQRRQGYAGLGPVATFRSKSPYVVEGHSFSDTPVPADDKQAFVADLARQHGQRLRQFLAKRLRNAEQDIPDLVQEVYLRLMRVPRLETIRSPQAYLFTVAFHVMYQHKLSLAAIPESVDILDALADSESYAQEDPATLLDARQRLVEMDRVLKQLPRNAHATFVLSRRYGYSLQEIAQQLGVSRGMVKKYLATAIAHFRRNFEEMESRI